MKITAMVLVGKNEPYLTYCVNSIEGIVDQIVFIPYKEGEETDFSKWRNQALKEAKGNWILYIDADEILAKPDGKPVTRAELELLAKNDKGIKAFSPFTLHFLYNYKMIDGTNNGQHYSQFRFFEKASVKEYRGKIHELPNFKVGTKVAPLHTMYIWHFGHCKGMEDLRKKYTRSMTIPGNPYKPHFEKFHNADEYCAQHELFQMRRPIMFYNGPLPHVMKLW